MLEACFRRFFYSGLEKHRIKTEAFTHKIIKLTNKIEQQMSDYDMLLNGIDTMVWLTYDPEKQGKANKALLDFFGRTLEEIEDKNLRELMSPEEAEFCIKVNREVFETGKPKTTYEWATRFDGEKRLLKISRRPKKNGVHYLVSSAEDITELEETRKKLQQECNFTESVIQTAQALILVLDTNANILRCNKYFENLTGYELNEIVGKNWFDMFINPNDRKSLERLFNYYTQEDNKEVQFFREGIINSIKTKDEKEILVEWYSQSLTDNCNVAIGVISIGQDVSQKKIIEEELWAKIIELEIKLKNMNDAHKGFIVKPENKGTETILLVDDESTVLGVISMMLQQHGYKVLEASSIAEALEYLDLKETRVDLLITDFYLPNMNGQQLISEAKRKFPDLKYLIISGLYPTTPVEIPKKYFLRKPFLLDDFMDKVTEVIRGDSNEEIKLE